MRCFGGGVSRLGLAMCLGVVLAGLVIVPDLAVGASSTARTVTGGVTGRSGYLVYWDQNEEVDFLSMPSGVQGQLLPGMGPQRPDVRPSRRPIRRWL